LLLIRFEHTCSRGRSYTEALSLRSSGGQAADQRRWMEGHEFTLLSYPRDGCPEFPLVVEAVAGYWQQNRVETKIRMSEWLLGGRPGVTKKLKIPYMATMMQLSPDVTALLQKFQDKWNFAYKSKRSTVNIPELEERFQRIENSMDIAEISRLLSEILPLCVDQYLMIPICEFPERLLPPKEYQNGIQAFAARIGTTLTCIRQR